MYGLCLTHRLPLLLAAALLPLALAGISLGKAAPEQQVQPESLEINVYFLIDNSDSMAGINDSFVRIQAAQLLLTVLRAGAEAFDYTVNAGVASFDTILQNPSPLLSIQDPSLPQKINTFDLGAYSDFVAPIRDASIRVNTGSAEARKAIVVFTDARPQTGTRPLSGSGLDPYFNNSGIRPLLNSLNEGGVQVYFFVVGSANDVRAHWEPLLPPQHYIPIDVKTDLVGLFHSWLAGMTPSGGRVDPYDGEHLAVQANLDWLEITIIKSALEITPVLKAPGEVNPEPVATSLDDYSDVYRLEQPATGVWSLTYTGAGSVYYWINSERLQPSSPTPTGTLPSFSPTATVTPTPTPTQTMTATPTQFIEVTITETPVPPLSGGQSTQVSSPTTSIDSNPAQGKLPPVGIALLAFVMGSGLVGFLGLILWQTKWLDSHQIRVRAATKLILSQKKLRDDPRAEIVGDESLLVKPDQQIEPSHVLAPTIDRKDELSRKLDEVEDPYEEQIIKALITQALPKYPADNTGVVPQLEADLRKDWLDFIKKRAIDGRRDERFALTQIIFCHVVLSGNLDYLYNHSEIFNWPDIFKSSLESLASFPLDKNRTVGENDKNRYHYFKELFDRYQKIIYLKPNDFSRSRMLPEVKELIHKLADIKEYLKTQPPSAALSLEVVIKHENFYREVHKFMSGATATDPSAQISIRDSWLKETVELMSKLRSGRGSSEQKKSQVQIWKDDLLVAWITEKITTIDYLILKSFQR